jgi:hypothetical protein
MTSTPLLAVILFCISRDSPFDRLDEAEIGAADGLLLRAQSRTIAGDTSSEERQNFRIGETTNWTRALSKVRRPLKGKEDWSARVKQPPVLR